MGSSHQTTQVEQRRLCHAPMSEQDVANMALYLASPFGATISGQSISIDGDLVHT